jgi:hypothetical protein
VADAAQDGAALCLLGRDADGPLRVAVAYQLGTVEGLGSAVAAGLAVALVAGAGVDLAAAGQAEAAEGVQVSGLGAVIGWGGRGPSKSPDGIDHRD